MMTLNWALLALAVMAAMAAWRMRDAAARVQVWLAALYLALLVAVAPVASSTRLWEVPMAWISPLGTHALGSAVPESLGSGPARFGAAAPVTAAGPDGLLWVYAVGALVMLARLAMGLWGAASLVWRSRQERGFRVSEDVAVPVSAFGVTVLPADWSEWGDDALTAALAHERAHARRGDFFHLLLARAVRALCWFNPAAWWLVRALTEAMEHSADDRAAAVLGDRSRYAEVLLRFAAGAPYRGMALAMASSRVGTRVERMLKPASRVPVWVRVAAVAAMVPLALVVAGQKKDGPPVAVVTPGHGTYVSGDINLDKLEGGFIYTVRDGATWVIKDPSTLEKAKALLKRVGAPEKVHAELEAEHRAMEKKHAELDELHRKMEQRKVKMPDLTAQLDELRAEASGLKEVGHEELGRLHEKLGALHEALGKLHEQLEGEGAPLRQEMESALKKIETLAGDQAALGARHAQLAKEMEREAGVMDEELRKLVEEAFAAGKAERAAGRRR